MRTADWIVISMAALAVAACSPKPAATPAPPAATAPSAPPLPAASAPAPESPQAGAITPETAAAPPANAATAPLAPPPAPPPPVHFSPADYPAREKRIAALINNAESRDTSGETQDVAAEGRAQRQRCTTKACIEGSYAAEEARLRKWEGSGDIK